MPVTPFHFGPGVLIHAVAPRQVSFLAFCAANVLIDLESLYNMVRLRYPIHVFFHTYVGATLAAIGTVAVFLAAQALARRLSIPDLFGWRRLTPTQISFGAAAGAYSHVIFDSIMHADMAPLAPFAAGNALLGVMSLEALHLACVAAAAVGALLLFIRRWRTTAAGR